MSATDERGMTRRPKLLDLYCGEGGAGMGYSRAGFDVFGVDISPQPNYPFTNQVGDALSFLTDTDFVRGHFDAIHASPPCQEYSSTRFLSDRTHDALVDVTRDALIATGLPWVMENVPGAPMPNAVMLCGSMFGLGAMCVDGQWRQLRRHRLFEHSPDVLAWPPYVCGHVGQPIGVYGNGGGGPESSVRGYKGTKAESCEALGTPWMSRRGVSQAIPPAYTEHIGAALLAAVSVTGAA